MHPFSICHHHSEFSGPTTGGGKFSSTSNSTSNFNKGPEIVHMAPSGLSGGTTGSMGTTAPTMPYFYPATNQKPHTGQRSERPSSNGKKTWSQRLKFNSSNTSNKNENSRNKNRAGLPPPASGGSQQSRSPLLEAISQNSGLPEPWLYGTVRGLPATPIHPFYYSPVHHHSRIPTEVAVVVCSCPEYLNGTNRKKEMKKASICKKCKGSRLPLAQIGGTVRLTPNNPYLYRGSPNGVIFHANAGRLVPQMGTLRQPNATMACRNNNKPRPSILNDDPYDLMRRSRLMAPLTTSTAGNGNKVRPSSMGRSRAKSSSPTRNRYSMPVSPVRSKPVYEQPPHWNMMEENDLDVKEPLTFRSLSMGRLHTVTNSSFDDCPQICTELSGDDLWVDGYTSRDKESSTGTPDLDPYELVRPGDVFERKPKRTIGNSVRSGCKNHLQRHTDEISHLLSTDESLDGISVEYENILKSALDSNEPEAGGQGVNMGDARKLSLINSEDGRPQLGPNNCSTATSLPCTTNIKKGMVTVESGLDVSPPKSGRKFASVNRTGDVQIRLNEGNSTPVVKSILKKYENVTFPAEYTTNINSTEASPVGGSKSESENSNRKVAGNEYSRNANFMLIKPSAEVLNKNHQKLSAMDSNVSASTPEPSSIMNGSCHVLTQKKVQFCDENESFSEQMTELKNYVEHNWDVCDKEKINNCRLVDDDVAEEVGERMWREKQCRDTGTSHNCDIKPTKVFIHKSLDDQFGATTAAEQMERLEGDDERSLSLLEPTLMTVTRPDPNSDPGRREITGTTTTLGTMLTEQTPIQGNGELLDSRQPVRRTLSDRKLRLYTNREQQFMDTMALRNKKRLDTRDIDFISSVDRPKDPPPPPPTRNLPTLTTPARPPRMRKASLTNGLANCSSAEINSYEPFNFHQSYRTNEVSSSNSHQAKALNTVTVQGNRIGRPGLTRSQRDSAAVHRLEIKNYPDASNCDTVHKRTSIIISGDDCYSTVNVGEESALYQSSVVVNESKTMDMVSNCCNNTVSINVGSNLILDLNTPWRASNPAAKSIIPILGPSENGSSSTNIVIIPSSIDDQWNCKLRSEKEEKELDVLLRNPVEAVRLNLIPHICGKSMDNEMVVLSKTSSAVPLNIDASITNAFTDDESTKSAMGFEAFSKKLQRNSFISKLLEDPTLGHLAEGLDNEVIAKLIESSLVRLRENLTELGDSAPESPVVDDQQAKVNMAKLIDLSLNKIQEERHLRQPQEQPRLSQNEDKERMSTNDLGSISSGNSFTSTNYEMFDFDNNPDSDCYQSCSSELTTEDDTNSARSKFYQMLVDATLSEIEICANLDDDHHYESIRLNTDPIYEEISEIPPPLPLSLPPFNNYDLEKKQLRSMFEGASKYDILSYLVDAKERGVVSEDTYTYSFGNASDVIIEESDNDDGGRGSSRAHKRQPSDAVSRISDGSDDTIVSSETSKDKLMLNQRKSSGDIERNDSGVGSETSKSSRNKFLNVPLGSVIDKDSPVHMCEDCDGPVETQLTESGVMYAPLVCRKCGKKRAERKEIITEIVETEEKYGRDLQIILEEFYQPMLVAGLLTQEQLSAIFLNTEELLENNQTLAERMRDVLDIASEQGDDDMLTVNVGKLFLDAIPMLHAFETYCVGQAAASLLLANLEKEKELLRIFLRVSQMENSVLRRMNLNSFLMVPVQRVTKYPLLLARLLKVTPPQLECRIRLVEAQQKIELHLNHMNQEAKDIPTKLWRRISSSSPGRRASCEVDMINIKLRKMAIDVLEWNHDEVRFVVEGKLLFTQPTDNNWRKGRTIKLNPINALLVSHGKPSLTYRADRALNEPVNFPRHTGIREASLLLVREKSGRYTLVRDPLYLDRCVIASESDWADYFEVQEISSKETFIFKAEDESRTKQWYSQLQYHSQGMGAWRKRRNALANIMINGMMMRS